MRLHIIVPAFLLLVMAGCSTDDPTRHNTFIPLTSMEVSGTYQSMAEQTVNQYRASGNFSGSFTRDITTEVSWVIADEAIATVSNETGSQGLVTALSPGQTSVTAFYGDFSQSAPVVVTDSFLTGIEIAPQDAALHADITQRYEAAGIFSDGSTQDVTTLVAWESSDPGIATIDSSGLATTLTAGTTTITGSWQGITTGTSLTVTGVELTAITIRPQDAVIALDTTVQFEAEGIFSDNSTQDITSSVNWESSATNVAIFNGEGLATGNAPGEAEISASVDVDGSTISATAALTVTSAFIETIAVTPANSTILNGTGQQFIATGFFSDNSQQDITELATWQTTNNFIGTISNSGLFASEESGTTFIIATFSGVNGQTLLTVE